MCTRKQFDVVVANEGDGARLDGDLVIKDSDTWITYPIINQDDRWYGDHLFAIAIGPISGWHGVYANNMQDALDILADWCEDHAPGLVDNYDNLLKEYDYDEQAVIDFNTGPAGNHGVYFTDGEIHFAKVQDDRVPAIPNGLFPVASIYSVDTIISGFYDDLTPKNYMIRGTWKFIKSRIRAKYSDKAWCEPLVEYIENNAGNLFDTEVSCDGTEFRVTIRRVDDD